MGHDRLLSHCGPSGGVFFNHFPKGHTRVLAHGREVTEAYDIEIEVEELFE